MDIASFCLTDVVSVKLPVHFSFSCSVHAQQAVSGKKRLST